ncbi:DUF6802 family protein [Rhodococcus erythropolis]|uniref:DUF6802 family protein n=1 Tax=Rhodococcus erythropolis TaxID=1833 RepID=UPI00294A4277|nr:DUF6802 family protein [Rhodococcus erythropolis]MDV6271990.1 DUF6802 family protein [Rhodococcus erythropolis]
MDAFLITAAHVDNHGLEAAPLDPGRIEPENFGPSSGPVDAGDLNFDAFDLDGDGTVDSRVVHSDDAVVIVSDFDRDGVADRLTMIESDVDYSSWECRRDDEGSLVWQKIDAGAL